jgi:uncharacterized protein YndB with AHSA1/START domain
LVVRFTCRLRHPVERVWTALTNATELAVWYPTRVRIDPQPGGRISFSFPGGDPFHGVVLEVEPPTLLVFTTLADTLRWRLAKVDAGCELTLDNITAHREHAPYTAAGFDINLNQLATLLDHGASQVHRREMPPPDELVDRYRSVFGETLPR